MVEAGVINSRIDLKDVDKLAVVEVVDVAKDVVEGDIVVWTVKVDGMVREPEKPVGTVDVTEIVCTGVVIIGKGRGISHRAPGEKVKKSDFYYSPMFHGFKRFIEYFYVHNNYCKCT